MKSKNAHKQRVLPLGIRLSAHYSCRPLVVSVQSRGLSELDSALPVFRENQDNADTNCDIPLHGLRAREPNAPGFSAVCPADSTAEQVKTQIPMLKAVQSQAMRIYKASCGKLQSRDHHRYDTSFPGQPSSSSVLLPPPCSVLLDKLRADLRPTPTSIVAWMQARRIHPSEALIERLLVHGPPLLPNSKHIRQILAAQPQGCVDALLQQWDAAQSPTSETQNECNLPLRVKEWIIALETAFAAPDATIDLDGTTTHCVTAREGAFATNHGGSVTEGVLDQRWLVCLVLLFSTRTHVCVDDLHLDMVPQLKGILQFIPTLTALSIQRNPLLTSDNLPLFVHACRNLRVLNVSGCAHLDCLGSLDELRHLDVIIALQCDSLGSSKKRIVKHIGVRKLHFQGSTTLQYVWASCPSVVHLDLSYLSCMRIKGPLTRLKKLDLAHTSIVQLVKRDFDECPALEHLCLRSCTKLIALHFGVVRTLKDLIVARCPALTALSGKLPHLTYLDAHLCNCSSRLAHLLKTSTRALSIEFQGFSQLSLIGAGGTTTRLLHFSCPGGDDASWHSSIDERASLASTFGPSDATCTGECVCVTHVTIKALRPKETPQICYVCSDDKIRAARACGAEFTSTNLLSDSLTHVVFSAKTDTYPYCSAIQEGVRHKLIRAAKMASKQLSERPLHGVHHDRKEETVLELRDAVELAEKVALRDFPLYNEIVHGVLFKVLTDQKLSCPLDCGTMLDSATFDAHIMNDCPQQKCQCNCVSLVVPKIGELPTRIQCTDYVVVSEMEHHKELHEELQAALLSWNVPNLQDKLDRCVPDDHLRFEAKSCKCRGCQFSTEIIFAAEQRLRQLEEKVAECQPVLERGNVSIDFDKNSLLTESDIEFEPRKPPDASAKFDAAGKERGIAILQDTAIVLNLFREEMLIEVHTGSVEPVEFYQKHATNRARLIVSTLADLGVRRTLMKAVGKPGGGSHVAIFPAR